MKKAALLFLILALGAPVLATPARASSPPTQTVGAVTRTYTFEVEARDLSAFKTDWNVWVSKVTEGQAPAALYIASDGRQTEVALPTQVAQDAPLDKLLAVSDSGMQLVYGFLSPGSAVLSLHVYDVPAGAVYVAEVAAPPGAEINTYNISVDVSDQGDAAAFGVSYFQAGQMPAGFDFFVWSLSGNTITYSMSSQTPAMAQNYEIDPGQRFLPIGVYLAAGWLEFGLLPWGTEAFGGDSFVWVFDTGAVYRGGTGGYLGGARLRVTGEHAYVSYDDAYTSCQCQPMMEFNVLEVYDPTAQRSLTIYNEMVVSLAHRAAWIEDGARIAFVKSDEASYTKYALYALDRAGVVEALGAFESEGMYTIQGVSGGALISIWKPDALELYHFAGDSPGGRLVWRMPLTEADSVGVVWATPAKPAGALPAFPEVEPVLLAVGGRATINSTGGDTVNVRAGAGTNYDVVTKLPEGAVVDITGGPAQDQVNYYTWWQVRSAGGQTGWVAEVIWGDYAGIRLLVPTP
ncbi:MAG: SH3 domain-containing protein [Anaerolineae bacterium]|nr:SH3 domain-containing protein [Anaerolineae bacterium]